MSKWGKLLHKLRNGSYDLAFEDLRKILISLGYIETLPGSGSSHHTFRKNGTRITIPRHEPIGRVYIMKVRKIVDEEEAINEQEY